MSKTLRTRIRRKLVSLIMNGSAYGIARMATASQGIGVAGLAGPRPKTTFRIVFTEHPDFLSVHERQAGVCLNLMSTPSLYLSDEPDGIRRLRRFEEILGVPKENLWTTRVANGQRDDDDDVWLEDWLSCLMDDHASVDRRVRQALIREIDESSLEEIEERIEDEINQLADERRYAES